MKRATLADVARGAGVSVKTASLALRGDRVVSMETTRLVRAAAENLSYERQGVGAPLLGVVTPLMNHPFYAEFHQLMEEVAGRQGYSLHIAQTAARRDELSVIAELDRERVDGIVLLSPNTPDAELRTVVRKLRPIVAINTVLHPRPGLTCVNFDQESGTRQMLQYLLDSGRRHIAYLSGPSGSLSNQARQRLHESFLSDHGLFDYRLVMEMRGSTPAGYEFGYSACQQLLERNAQPDAVFAYNDLVAVGAMRAIFDMSRDIPTDVAVVGFDDLDVARFTRPRLATVQVPRRQAAGLAIRRLMDAVEAPDISADLIVLPTEFIPRESARIPQKRGVDGGT